MKKDFITVSPDNGGGTTQVNVVADPNSTFQSRSTTLNFSAGGYHERQPLIKMAYRLCLSWVLLHFLINGMVL
jgi:hypothetical protein